MVKMSNHEHIDDLDVPEISSCRLINCKLESFPPVPLPLHKAVFLPWASYSKISPLRLNQNSMCRIFLPGQISFHSSSSQSGCLLSCNFQFSNSNFQPNPPFTCEPLALRAIYISGNFSSAYTGTAGHPGSAGNCCPQLGNWANFVKFRQDVNSPANRMSLHFSCRDNDDADIYCDNDDAEDLNYSLTRMIIYEDWVSDKM